MIAVRAPVRQAARINQLRNNAGYISMGGRQRFDRPLDTADLPTRQHLCTGMRLSIIALPRATASFARVIVNLKADLS